MMRTSPKKSWTKTAQTRETPCTKALSKNELGDSQEEKGSQCRWRVKAWEMKRREVQNEIWG